MKKNKSKLKSLIVLSSLTLPIYLASCSATETENIKDIVKENGNSDNNNLNEKNDKKLEDNKKNQNDKNLNLNNGANNDYVSGENNLEIDSPAKKEENLSENNSDNFESQINNKENELSIKNDLDNSNKTSDLKSNESAEKSQEKDKRTQENSNNKSDKSDQSIKNETPKDPQENVQSQSSNSENNLEDKNIQDSQILTAEKDNNQVENIASENGDNLENKNISSVDEFYFPKYEGNYFDSDINDDKTIALPVLKDVDSQKRLRKEYFNYSNIVPTGIYLEPGKKYLIQIDLDHKIENGEVTIIARQGSKAEKNTWDSLNYVEWYLKKETNQIEFNLINKKEGHLVYLENTSGKPVTATIKNLNKQETPFSTFPFYIYNPSQPEKFWDYLSEIQNNKNLAQSTFMQFSDPESGGIQVIWSTQQSINTFINQLKLDSKQKATDYIKTFMRDIKEWVDELNKFNGLDKNDPVEAQRPTNSPLLIQATLNIKKPSIYYASKKYVHLPEDLVSEYFKNTSALYGWVANHEKGHVIDNTSIVVVEVTNNMYASYAGYLNMKKVIASGNYNKDKIKANNFVSSKYWDAEPKHFNYLSSKIQDPSTKTLFVEVSDENKTPFYPVYVWFLTSQFMNKYDYSNYDFNNQNDVLFTKKEVDNIKKFGVWGTLQRLLRDRGELNKYDKENLFDIFYQNNKMNRLPLLYSIVTGFDFSDVFSRFGQENIDPRIAAFTARYPKLDKKIEYYNVMGEVYDELNYPEIDQSLKPEITYSSAVGNGGKSTKKTLLKISLNKDVFNSLIVYEIYVDGKLYLISKPKNSIVIDGDISNKNITVKAYDYKLNESSMSEIATKK
ncbi:hypothetical protein [Mesomycoplasma lagogenitalium]|uniref:Peptidase M60 domain-containing protein n=1 Tax=Mesomycoplasma lagogenitalium TaxID=171286 RepID=A0ABY8LVZ1_9BACT|nr:hypothetical protein [Mesomycoplasma lagogenitalium]WGI36703.1 hypothetical protein QEG99_00235 [Mesomycoplasma lagogenitalium]